MSEEKLSSADVGLTEVASAFVPEQYAECHSFQSGSNSMTLELFQPCFTRVPDASQQFLDLGCGTGDFTQKELLPQCQPCRRIVAVDSSLKMIQYAEANFAHPQIIYDFLDIRKDVSEFINKYGQFDRVYSFFVLHWTKNQYSAFKNISDLMTPVGECLLTFGARIPAYDIWRRMVKKDRWTSYKESAESFIPQTHDMSDRSALISHMLNILKAASLKPRSCEVLKIAMKAEHLSNIIEINMGFVPFLSQLPEGDKETFKKDFKNEIRQFWTEKFAERPDHFAEQYLIHAVKV